MLGIAVAFKYLMSYRDGSSGTSDQRAAAHECHAADTGARCIKPFAISFERNPCRNRKIMRLPRCIKFPTCLRCRIHCAI